MTSLTNQIQQDNKEELLKAAEGLFAEYGFAGASIRVIAESSGVKALINYYFGSKEALYSAIFATRLKQISDEVRKFEDLTMDPYQKLEAYLNTLISQIEANKDIHRLLCNQLATMHLPTILTMVSETRKQVYTLIRSIVHEGIQNGCFRAVDEEVFALNVLSLFPSVLTGHTGSLIYRDCTLLSQPAKSALRKG